MYVVSLVFLVRTGLHIKSSIDSCYHGELTLAASLPQEPQRPGQCLPWRPDTELQGVVTVSQLILGRLWAAFDPHNQDKDTTYSFPGASLPSARSPSCNVSFLCTNSPFSSLYLCSTHPLVRLGQLLLLKLKVMVARAPDTLALVLCESTKKCQGIH